MEFSCGHREVLYDRQFICIMYVTKENQCRVFRYLAIDGIGVLEVLQPKKATYAEYSLSLIHVHDRRKCFSEGHETLKDHPQSV